MKNTNKKPNDKLYPLKNSFTSGNITMYSGINVVAKNLKRKKVGKTPYKLFPTTWCNSTKFSAAQVLMSIIFATLSGLYLIVPVILFFSCYCYNLLVQFRYFIFNYIPNNRIIDSHIVANQPVFHSCHVFPLN
jgi:hypothetical protein